MASSHAAHIASLLRILPALWVGFGLALAWQSPSHAQRGRVICVSSGGSDRALGSTAAPFKTIARALRSARPGTTELIRSGVYTERVRLTRSGADGRPIILQGERGPGGEWRTVIDSSGPLRVKWTAAPEIGPGVYKTPFPGFEPRQMLVDGKFIPRIWQDHMRDGSGFKELAFPPDHKVKTYYAKSEIRYWDPIGAMFGTRDGLVYLRFRDRDDPNTKDLRAAPAGGGVQIENQSHIVVRDLMVRGGENCVLITGPRATNNVVERCRLLNGAKRVRLTDGAALNIIRDNEMTIEFFAKTCITGAWGCLARGDMVPYENRLKQQFYRKYKLFFGPNSTSDYGIRVFRAGSGNEVCRNRVFVGGQGISVNTAGPTRVHHNTVWGFSSIGIICTLNNVQDIRIHDNLVYDSNINLRIHHVNEYRQRSPRSLYVFRNRFWQKPGTGSQIYFHYHKKHKRGRDYEHAHIFMYQNSFAGGTRGLSVSGYADECEGLPNLIVVNNVFSCGVGVWAARDFIVAKNMIGALDYNWLGGGFKTRHPGHDYTTAPWYGKHNIFVKGARIWDAAKQPDFKLPPNSRARQAGLNLAKPCVVNTRKFGPLPGMKPGYFTPPAPDLGAVQSR